ncbi:hypothetical protein LCGC14_2925460, partial [marine sediment metagenome]
GPIASNVVIRNNRLIGVGQSRHYGGTGRFGAIMVRTNGTGFKLAPERSISNISILDNEIIDPPKNALYIGSARDVTISGNRVTASADSTSFGPNVGICLENASGVKIRDFRFLDPRETVQAGVLIRQSTAPGKEGVVIQKLDVRLPKGVKAVLDQR